MQRRLAAHLAGYSLTKNSFFVRREGEPRSRCDDSRRVVGSSSRPRLNVAEARLLPLDVQQDDEALLQYASDQGREIAKGLYAAHERGLIHRDIKPGNLWLDAQAQGRIRILDFGLARPAETDCRSRF